MKFGMTNLEWEKIKEEVFNVNQKLKKLKAFYRDSYSRKENTDKYDHEIIFIKILDDDERMAYSFKDCRQDLYPNIKYWSAYNKIENIYEDAHWFLKNLVWKK